MNKLAIQDLVRDYSIETTVAQSQRVARFDEVVASGTRVYIPHTPRTTFRETVTLTARLRKEGMEPVPHIVARRIESLAALDDLLGRLTEEAGVAQVLVVAGDTAARAGQLDSALQILESGLLEKRNLRTVGVAGHPEGHPQVSDSLLRDALRRKNAYAASSGSNVYIVTQFTFSAEPVIEWELSHHDDIGRLPINAGLPGLATVNTLLKYAIECGVGASLEAFSKRYASLTKLLTITTPDSTIVSLARYKDQTARTQLSGVHFFTFGGFKKTAEWANKIVAGQFDLTPDGKIQV